MVRNDQHFTWKHILKRFNLTNKTGHQDALNLSVWSKLFKENGFQIESIYPDHWPWYRMIKTLMPWNQTDSSRLIRFPGKIELAYEFIFHLTKA
jgi:hypothetical protein